MKAAYLKIFLSGIVGCCLLLLASCTEIGPPISLVDIKPLRDTTYINTDLPPAQHRKVLFEEFTGVNCNNCPRGHETAKDINSAHPDSVILVAVHNDNPLAKPFANEVDFRTQEGIQISQRVGGSSAIPSAAIDRTLFSGQNNVAQFRPFWEDRVKQRLTAPVPVNIDLSTDYEDGSREVTIGVKLHYLQDVDSTNQLSIYIVEDDIVTLQLLQDLSVDSNYVHNHVLRGMVTHTFGTATNPTTEEGRVIERDLLFTLPPEWNADNCTVVAFVHYVGNGDQVLQANSASVR